jgi:hypothetical protein
MIRATNATGHDASAAELLNRLNAIETHATTVAVRGGAVHGLDEHIDALLRATTPRFGSTAITTAVHDALRRAIDEQDDDSTVRIDLYRGRADEAYSILLFAEPTNSPTSPAELEVDGTPVCAFDVRTSAGNICLVTDHRFVWPESPHPHTVTARLIHKNLQSMCLRTVILPVSADDLAKFDGAFVVGAFGAVPLSTIDKHSYLTDATDAHALRTAFELTAWTKPERAVR